MLLNEYTDRALTNKASLDHMPRKKKAPLSELLGKAGEI